MIPRTRRDFLRVAAVTAAGSGLACSADSQEPPPPVEQPEAKRMKLSMSARVAESFFNKKESSLTLEELIALARDNGYSALCMRASTVGIHSPKGTVQDYAGKIRATGLAVSMVTGDFKIPSNGDDGPDVLRNVTPYLDLAEAFGSNLIRVCPTPPSETVQHQI